MGVPLRIRPIVSEAKELVYCTQYVILLKEWTREKDIDDS